MAKIHKPGQLFTFKIGGVKHIVRLKKREQTKNAYCRCYFSYNHFCCFANTRKYRAATMACMENDGYYYELVKTIVLV